jgi:hypothetical protein
MLSFFIKEDPMKIVFIEENVKLDEGKIILVISGRYIPLYFKCEEIRLIELVIEILEVKLYVD